MISIITPTHNVQHLAETYASLCAQTQKYFEWVVVPNGGVTAADIQAITGDDTRVSIYPLLEQIAEMKSIGAIKLFSFLKGKGDYLLELDHDDLLASTALADIEHAFEISKADFVYSNTCEYFENGLFHYFPDYQSNGWRYRTAIVDGKEVNECLSFEPSAAALSLIYYAPNHVRVWRKEFYIRIGGHKMEMPICDDHELCVRTYLKGKMHHLDKCLYLYRMGNQNTFSKRLGEIRERTFNIYAENIEALILREAELKGLQCVDLGGGFNSPTGWTAVDINEGNGVDIVADLNERWPWEDNSVMAFRLFDIAEHLKDKMHVMNEIHRCLVPGGYAHFQVPDCRHMGGSMDPTHVSYWNPGSFWYYTRAEQMKYIHNEKTRFIEQRLFEFFPSPWHEANDIKYVKAELICVKDSCEGIPGYRRF